MTKEKESWLTKLIELLNEYKWKEEWTIECDVPHNDWYSEYAYEHEELIIISKKYWFIKWLVENEKIKWDEKFYLEDDEWLFGTYECLLMQLAIQDEPINFLISILK